MARFRRKAKVRRTSSRSGFFTKKSRSRNSGGSVNLIQFDAMIYGGLRGYTSNLLAPIVAKIPLGSIADEVVMGGVNYLVAKNTSGILKNIALKGLVIENARLGEAIATGGIGNLISSGSGITGSNAAIYDY